MTSGFVTDQRVEGGLSVYPLCEAIRWSLRANGKLSDFAL
jgi:hypothetical protein